MQRLCTPPHPTMHLRLPCHIPFLTSRLSALTWEVVSESALIQVDLTKPPTHLRLTPL